MAKIGKAFVSLFLLSSLCLAVGIYLARNGTTDDPLSKSPLALIVGATLIGFGLAALYLGIKAYRRHRAVVLHISRRQLAKKRSRLDKKRRTRQEG